MENIQEKIEEITNRLVTKNNEFIVRKQSVNLTPGSFGNPVVSVGTLPFYDWSKDKKITYVISNGRYLDCRMLCDKAYEKDKDYIVTTSYKKAQQLVKEILQKYAEKK